MKPLVYPIVLILLLLVSPTLLAQQTSSPHLQNSFHKGTIQLTASYGYGQGDLLAHRNVLGFQVGYYVANRLSVGVVGSLTREWLDNFYLPTHFSAGPFIRYQFLDRRLSPFVEMAYQYGQPTFITKQGAFVTPGVNLRLFSLVRLEASYGLLVLPSREIIGQPQLGLTVLVSHKR